AKGHGQLSCDPLPVGIRLEHPAIGHIRADVLGASPREGKRRGDGVLIRELVLLRPPARHRSAVGRATGKRGTPLGELWPVIAPQCAHPTTSASTALAFL